MDMGKMMKQVQKMQGQMAKMQDELAKKTVEASAGGGMVTVTANGQQEIVGIKIDPDAVDPDDVEMLEDLILAAVNESMRKVQDMTQKEMGKLTGGMNIPGLF
ncbi:hypothetical protein BX659_12022 [Orenia metallireducens]|nr:YbaB/EbfC family nucleoid-associated protein [Orenia metallireducens]PRX26433.1 hypothetical protein BX659_12022 [Orenia metallireducens]SNY28585.1 hypothetical protein SAMN06265827_11222 [Orenia metallireducens]